MNKPYLHPSNRQFAVRDTEVNEGQTLDAIKTYRNKGLQFVGNVVEHIKKMAGHVSRKISEVTPHIIKNIKHFDPKSATHLDKLAQRVVNFSDRATKLANHAGKLVGLVKPNIMDHAAELANRAGKLVGLVKPNIMDHARNFVSGFHNSLKR